MTAHLLLITIGPVQDFIAQARRTRDLWFGSHMLSELSRCVAKSLADENAELIFPALKKGDHEFEFCDGPLRPPVVGAQPLPPLSIANKILAVVTNGDPSKLATIARTAVFKLWTERAGIAKNNTAVLLAAPSAANPTVDVHQVWDEQISSLLEFAATWAEIADGDQGYAKARIAVEQGIAARKNLRDFGQWRQQRGGAPKSSLDGGRETVLLKRDKDSSGPAKDCAKKYRIADAEQLDAVGLVKRAGGEPNQFVPLTNIALACWLQAAAEFELKNLRKACKDLDLARVDRPDLPCTQPFGYDASILLPDRWKPTFEEQRLAGDPVSWGTKHVRPLLNTMSEPLPYVACLVADGDKMGGAIEELKNQDLHFKFSKQLSDFATDARRIVEQEHLGSLVYAGGDDVLAFLPLPEALDCAEKLRTSFAKIMQAACAGLPDDKLPTLSVGIGIGHVLEGMGDLLNLGREAEKLAKSGHLKPEKLDRNALAIILDKRSGGRRQSRGRWDGDPVAQLKADVETIAAGLSTRKIYEIAATLKRLPPVKPDDTPTAVWLQQWLNVLKLEVERSLSRVEGEKAIGPAKAGLDLAACADYRAAREHVRGWIDRMLIARFIASATPEAKSKPIAPAVAEIAQ